MFIPLHDDTPLRIIRFQWMTVAILVLNVGIFLATGVFSSEVQQASLANNFGLVPAQVIAEFSNTGQTVWLPQLIALFTYPFIHASWLHLIGNMLFLWVFADNIEDAYGPLNFVLFYIMCGLAGGLLHLVMAPQSDVPLLGASAAVSGILAAYVILFPRARVWILLFMRIPVPLPALYVLGGWFVFQIISLVMAKPESRVAWWAHIGGFAMGFVVTKLTQNLLFRLRKRV